eukprot:CAMPEP_0172493522 /NCGR_PEP_ID=MMETSP1066-20121228/24972_1 /TAXON_ID=671091 /ORGANISM="Coscinodiscus wailesii, Strain CCMP2513" /LENGTH=60 /DNA_ID=CAMNT_0013263729 /DNA_START=692 /DNA_END=871 /DNA_ORIENTATION=+
MTSCAVDEESEGSETNSSYDIVRFAICVHEVLCEYVTNGETNKRGKSFSEEGLRIEEFIV